jgi:hypothetical protein
MATRAPQAPPAPGPIVSTSARTARTMRTVVAAYLPLKKKKPNPRYSRPPLYISLVLIFLLPRARAYNVTVLTLLTFLKPLFIGVLRQGKLRWNPPKPSLNARQKWTGGRYADGGRRTADGAWLPTGVAVDTAAPEPAPDGIRGGRQSRPPSGLEFGPLAARDPSKALRVIPPVARRWDGHQGSASATGAPARS